MRVSERLEALLKRRGLKMADRTTACSACSPGSMRGRIEAVRPQQGGILALARGSWGPQSGVSRVSSFLTAGLGSSGSEVLWAEGGGFRLAEAVLPNPKVGLSRTPPLWSVLGGQARREEELRTEHLCSLGPTRGPGQVGPHVGPLSGFCSVLCLVLSFLLLLQRGRSRPCQRKGDPPYTWV